MIPEETLKQIKKLPKQKREQLHRIILWVIIPLVVMVWFVSFAATIKRISGPQASPPPVFGQQVTQGVRLFFSRLGDGLSRVSSAVSEAAASVNFNEKFTWWWKKVTRQPVINPVESVSPVVLPVAPPETLL